MMFGLHPFVVALLAAAHIPSASSFQSGSDYDVYKTLNLYNCTGNVASSNVTVPNAVDTLPQIEPSAEQGWEQWSLYFHGTFPMLLRWSKGDPTLSVSSSGGQFDVVAYVNGSTIQRTVVGNPSYTNDEHVKQISIGGNTLTWDSDALWYNVSLSIEGYKVELDSLSATLDSFHPNVAYHNGLLDQTGEWFGSVPLLRGQVVGNLYTPSQGTFALSGLSVMRHMFSKNPLPSYIDRYTGGTIWGYSTTFYDSHVFYQTETTNGSVHEAAFLGRALPNSGQHRGFSSAWATYAVTDDVKLYDLSIDLDTNGINATFSGCTETDDIPQHFNVTALTPLAEFTDLGGGKTSYYMIANGSTSAGFDGVVTVGAVAGVVEEYKAPLMVDDCIR